MAAQCKPLRNRSNLYFDKRKLHVLLSMDGLCFRVCLALLAFSRHFFNPRIDSVKVFAPLRLVVQRCFHLRMFLPVQIKLQLKRAA